MQVPLSGADGCVHDVAAEAATLRALHVPARPVVLANVWDSATARLAQSSGSAAVATASAAVAPANGYEDHGRLPPDIAFAVLARIAKATTLPLSADLEDGYGLPSAELAERTIAAGACGLNLEDTDYEANDLVAAARQAERIAALKAAGRSLGVDLVVNARTDVLLHGGGIDDALKRAEQYRQAGADCVYPIFLADLAAIGEFAAGGPTNILWRPGGPRLREIAKAGAARISVGPVLFQLMLQRLGAAMGALLRLEDEGVS